MRISLSVPRAVKAEFPPLSLGDLPARRSYTLALVIVERPAHLASLGLVGRRDAPVAASARKRRLNAAGKEQENRAFLGGHPRDELRAFLLRAPLSYWR